MASLFHIGAKYYIAYKLNGKRITKPIGLDYEEKNKSKAELIKREIVKLEKENKLKIKYGAIKHLSGNMSLKLSEAASLYRGHIKKNKSNKVDFHTRTFDVATRKFFKYVNPNTPIKNITVEDIINFRNSVWNEISNASIRTYIRYLKGFFNYLVDYDYLVKTPIRKGINPKAEYNPIKIFKEKDIQIILEKAKERDVEYYNIYRMLLLTGIRPCDLFTLKAGNFDLEKQILQFRMSKTQINIDFPLYKEFRNFIREGFSDFKHMKKNENIIKKYSVDRIGKTLRKILVETGLQNESYNLKTFRKTFATSLAEQGISEGDVADMLGHTSISTTRQYYKRKNAESIRRRIDSIEGLKIC